MKSFSALGSANIIFDNNLGNNFLATVTGFNARSVSPRPLKQRKDFMKDSEIAINCIAMKEKRFMTIELSSDQAKNKTNHCS